MTSVNELAPQSLILPETFPGLRIAHSGVDVGNTEPRFGDIEQVKSSRAVLREAIQLSEDDPLYVIVPQSETDYVDVDSNLDRDRISQSEAYEEIEVVGDATITRRSSVGLMLNAADCIPLAILEPDKRILALIHIGWRGAVFNFHEKVLDYAVGQYGFDPDAAFAYLGPSIHQKSFKTEELHPAQQSADWETHISQRDDGFYVDIPGFVVSGLTNYGLDPHRIHQNPIDTGAPDSGHFSFTKHKNVGVPNGRNGFAVSMV
jgi:copper oxidase (laccase) domain-containing protein